MTDATCEPSLLGAKTGDDARADFTLGDAVFYQNGTWIPLPGRRIFRLFYGRAFRRLMKVIACQAVNGPLVHCLRAQ